MYEELEKEKREKEIARKKAEKEKRQREHEARVAELGPNFPKVWDLSYVKEKNQIGYSYQVINETLPVNPEKQFVRFMRENSDGLNSLGQTFLVQSIEAFVYSILGAQADGRFSIVNQSGKSLQTQQIFHQLVKSSIVQNDNTITINNFRTSIKDTNQILNQNISPGYYNAITTSTQTMRFGVNQNLNKTAPVKSTGSNNNNGRNYEKRWTDKGFTHNKNPLRGTGNYGNKKNHFGFNSI